jgi:hypothetical protein
MSKKLKEWISAKFMLASNAHIRLVLNWISTYFIVTTLVMVQAKHSLETAVV